mmetsp:Transcript_14227/g.49051  ORF Transcript_14227/g.49051 Transcript_14227/m.49051 type:complete len:207 (+) Transcript_14227:649-1269(+)
MICAPRPSASSAYSRSRASDGYELKVVAGNAPSSAAASATTRSTASIHSSLALPYSPMVRFPYRADRSTLRRGGYWKKTPTSASADTSLPRLSFSKLPKSLPCGWLAGSSQCRHRPSSKRSRISSRDRSRNEGCALWSRMPSPSSTFMRRKRSAASATSSATLPGGSLSGRLANCHAPSEKQSSGEGLMHGLASGMIMFMSGWSRV